METDVLGYVMLSLACSLFRVLAYIIGHRGKMLLMLI